MWHEPGPCTPGPLGKDWLVPGMSRTRLMLCADFHCTTGHNHSGDVGVFLFVSAPSSKMATTHFARSVSERDSEQTHDSARDGLSSVWTVFCFVWWSCVTRTQSTGRLPCRMTARVTILTLAWRSLDPGHLQTRLVLICHRLQGFLVLDYLHGAFLQTLSRRNVFPLRTL